jgi:hypothetical protein
VEVSTLILLGAAGGLLRGLLDVYTQFMSWQVDRRVHRQVPTEQEGDAPQFGEYYDPVADPIATILHGAMGAGAAVLFGTTGQISGAYAALVVGMSAPMLLTQLSRVQSVSDAITGGAQAAAATEAEAAAQPAALSARQSRAGRSGRTPFAPDSGPAGEEEAM